MKNNLKKYQSKTQLVLGTAQLGLNYGINNHSGKPSVEKSFEILNAAFQNGITTFDTANAYGDAEKLLGEFIKIAKLKDKIKVISKSKPATEGFNSMRIQNEVEESLSRLGIDKLDSYLLHSPEDMYNDQVIDSLHCCKKNNLIKNFGVSIYTPEDALFAVKELKIDSIQIPYNVFDQRLKRTDFFEFTKKNKIKVFARSAFLQGILFMADSKIPKHLSKIKEYLNLFDEIISQYKISRLQAALLFVYHTTGIDYLVFGVDNVNQLKQTIEITNSKLKNFSTCLEELNANFDTIDEKIISPNLW